ncbi:MAG: hypothetical protein ACETVY_01945 [Candidatus Bathyarchaeia archaeon]
MESYKTTEQLTIKDAIIYTMLFIAITWGFTLVSTRWLEQLTAQAVGSALRAIGLLSSWGVQEGDAYLSLVGENGLIRVTIIRECTAINVFAIVVGLILPLKTGSLKRKSLGIVFSAALLFLMNVSRIMLTVYLTGFNVPPFSWYFTNPTVEVYHYPISFIYGVIGVAILIVALNRWILPELGDTLFGIIDSIRNLLKLD